MSYHKMTSIGGFRADGSSAVTVRSGHWKPVSMVALARRMKLVRDVTADHKTADMSGLGYGGYDKNFVIDPAAGTCEQIPLTRYQMECNVAGDAEDFDR